MRTARTLKKHRNMILGYDYAWRVAQVQEGGSGLARDHGYVYLFSIPYKKNSQKGLLPGGLEKQHEMGGVQ